MDEDDAAIYNNYENREISWIGYSVFAEHLAVVWSFRQSELSFKLIIKWRRSEEGFVEITDEELIEFVEEQENTNNKEENTIRRPVTQELHSDIKPVLFCLTFLHELHHKL